MEMVSTNCFLERNVQSVRTASASNQWRGVAAQHCVQELQKSLLAILQSEFKWQDAQEPCAYHWFDGHNQILEYQEFVGELQRP